MAIYSKVKLPKGTLKIGRKGEWHIYYNPMLHKYWYIRKVSGGIEVVEKYGGCSRC